MNYLVFQHSINTIHTTYNTFCTTITIGAKNMFFNILFNYLLGDINIKDFKLEFIEQSTLRYAIGYAPLPGTGFNKLLQ